MCSEKGRNFTSPSGFLFCLPPPFVMDKEKGFCGAPPQSTSHSQSPELYDPMHIPTTPKAQKLIRAQNCSYSGTQQPTINKMLQLNIQNNQMASQTNIYKYSWHEQKMVSLQQLSQIIVLYINCSFVKGKKKARACHKDKYYYQCFLQCDKSANSNDSLNRLHSKSNYRQITVSSLRWLPK